MESEQKILQYVPFKSCANTSFWNTFTKMKLNDLRLSTDPIPITATYSRRIIKGIPPLLHFDHESFTKSSSTSAIPSSSVGDTFVSGLLINKNRLQDFKNENKVELLRKNASRVWGDIISGEAERNPSALGSFLMLLFADLKKYNYYYWCSFPVFAYPKNVKMISTPLTLNEYFNDSDLIEKLTTAFRNFDCDKSYFAIERSGENFTVFELSKYYENLSKKDEDSQLFLCFSDPCSAAEVPGWPLRNLLTLAAVRWSTIQSHKILCLRESIEQGRINLSDSLIFDIFIPDQGTPVPDSVVPDVLGWEKNERGKLGPKLAVLGSDHDPEKIAESAVALNLKLMRWRLVPDLNLDAVKDCRCLLIGAGTLGCNVARCLLGWGVTKISLVDCGSVSFSNPVRQSLYNFQDCLEDGKPKATCAAEALRRIYPNVDATGHNLMIPMPGHTIGVNQVEETKNIVKNLEELVKNHDAIFLLTDSRESRWLMSLLGAVERKIVLTAALGFDSYVILRHGIHSDEGKETLGCYYCNDVVVPGNSTADRTLDQQCTVTRPGLSFMVAGHIVELLVGILQHPLKGEAPCSEPKDASSPDNHLGVIPHSMRFYLAAMKQLITSTIAFKNCSACGPLVRSAYEENGFEFLHKVFDSCKFLEEMSGLTQLHVECEEADLWELSDNESISSSETT